MDGQPMQSGGMEQNKIMAILGYIIPFLFFIPLVTDAKTDAFAKFHANQQLNLLLFGVVGWTLASILTAVVIGVLLFPIVSVASLVFAVLGIINVSKGEMKPLPLIGGFSLIK